MRVYQYLFYRLYKRQLTKFSEFESLIFALLTITAIVFINLYTLDIGLNKLISTPALINSKVAVISAIIIIFGLNCFFFLLKKRYRDIEQKFGNETKEHKRLGLFGIIAYIIVSFVLFFISAGL